MDDIFLDDPRQISAKAVSAKNKAERKLKKRRFREYFADWIIKSLICAVLIGIDFTLFAEAGSYSLFDNTQTLNTEAIIIYSAIAAVSFAILFLLSFSLFLQDLFTAIIAGFFVGASSWWTLLASVISLFRRRFRPRHMLTINHVAGLVIGILGIYTILSTFFSIFPNVGH